MRPCNDSRIAYPDTLNRGMGGGGDGEPNPPAMIPLCLRKNKRGQGVSSVRAILHTFSSRFCDSIVGLLMILYCVGTLTPSLAYAKLINKEDRLMDKEDILGSFKVVNGGQQELIKEIVSLFHYRNGMPNHDGSMGAIVITPKELRDCLAYMGDR